MGVCCIVFDIDGMLFEFFMNFLNIEKKKLRFFFLNFMFSSCFMLFPTLKKKNIGVKKNIGGGGGGGQHLFLFFEKCPFTYWLNGRWFLQIVGIYIQYNPLFPCSDF